MSEHDVHVGSDRPRISGVTPTWDPSGRMYAVAAGNAIPMGQTRSPIRVIRQKKRNRDSELVAAVVIAMTVIMVELTEDLRQYQDSECLSLHRNQ